MILWFFDSWLGGKRVMEDFQKVFPHIPMILEMDRENAPYGEKSGDEIRVLTKAWVDRLFARGADVVILACNTASVHALRWLQRDIYPDRHILWVTVPWAEAVVEGGYRKIGILATDATVRSRMYRERVHILDDSVIVEEISAPGLVPLIEQGITAWEEIDGLLHEYLSQFSADIEALVLGCTHYPIIRENIEKIWHTLTQQPVDIVDPGQESARKFQDWMKRRWYSIHRG